MDKRRVNKLVREIARGNAAAAEELYALMKRPLMSFAAPSLRDFPEAEDVVQSVFLKIIQKSREMTYFTDAFGAFALVNVATNIALNLILLIAYAADASYCGTGMTFSFCLAALALEVIVVGVEYFVLRKFIGEKYFFWYVLSANALSAVAGSIVLTLLMTA